MPLDEENENIESHAPEEESTEMESEPPAEEIEEMERGHPRKIKLKAIPPPAKKAPSTPAPKPVLIRPPELEPKAEPAAIPKHVLTHVGEDDQNAFTSRAATEESAAKEDSEEAEIAGEFGTRWLCPNCGNTFRPMIREVTDKTIVLSTNPAIYGKKLVCGKCGNEWRQE